MLRVLGKVMEHEKDDDRVKNTGIIGVHERWEFFWHESTNNIARRTLNVWEEEVKDMTLAERVNTNTDGGWEDGEHDVSLKEERQIWVEARRNGARSRCCWLHLQEDDVEDRR